jgi:uncharacterized protein (TIGR03066 family)
MGFALALLGVSACSSGREATNAEKIVGTWKVSKPAQGTPPDTILEFTRDGRLIWSATVNDRLMRIEGKYRVEGDVFHATRDIGGVEERRKIKIKTLSDTTLVTVVPEGTVDEYQRK